MGNDWDARCDVLVVGTGAAGLTGAVTAADRELDVLVVEKLDRWGGTTAYSGGGAWIPNNFLMRRQGANDSAEAALQYMESVIDDVGPCSSRERKEAYVEKSPKMVEFLRDLGFEWNRASLYPDYYPSVEGARTGRIVEGAIFDGNRLGEWRETLMAPPGMPPVAMQSADAALLPLMTRTWRGFKRTMKVVGKTIGWRLTMRSPLGMGRSLVAQLMNILQSNHDVPVWLETELLDLVTDGGRVIGAIVDRQGERLRVKAERGVLLGAGGFAQNDGFRREHQPVGDDWTSVAPGDEGDAIRIAEGIGADLAMMEKSWWGASFELDGEMQFSVWERSMPGSILVDQDGVRYANESTSYVDLGRSMLERDERLGNAVPSWLILDNHHRRRYMFGSMPPGYTPSRHVEEGSIIEADSLSELAEQCEIDPEQLAETVDRFNGFARNGIDEDFRRGDGIYDRYYGDPRVQPNPNLAPIENAPFRAIRMYPGDLGTKGGLVTDEHARVLREDGSVIEGLYASGNTTASVMGQTYPGPGATIGPAATFSYLAMLHAAEARRTEEPSSESAAPTRRRATA